MDSSIKAAEALETGGERRIKLLLRANATMVFVYKLDDQPNKTTLATAEAHLPSSNQPEGPWRYVDQDNGTLWRQTNTIVFKNGAIGNEVTIIPMAIRKATPAGYE